MYFFVTNGHSLKDFHMACQYLYWSLIGMGLKGGRYFVYTL